MAYSIHDAEDFTLEVGNTTSNGLSGSGVSPRLAYFSGTNTLTSNAGMQFNASPGQLELTSLFYQHSTITAATGLIAEVARIVPIIDPTAIYAGPFAGLNITNDTSTGSHITMDAFFHALQVNVGAASPNAGNEVAAIAAFIYQNGLGSVFGHDGHAYSQPSAAGFPPNIVGGQFVIHNNKTSGVNTSNQWGLLVNNSSSGVPNTGAENIGIKIQRDPFQDYSSTVSRTVTVTNGLPTVTIANGNWQTLEQSYPIDITGKKIKLPNGVYTIQSVDTALQITLTGNYTGPSLGGQAFSVRVAEPFTFQLALVRSSDFGIVIYQDGDFPPPSNYYAIIAKDQTGFADVSGVTWAGDYFGSSMALYGAAPTAPAGWVCYGSDTQLTVGAAGAAAAVPATASGYLEINVSGTPFVVPYFAKA